MEKKTRNKLIISGVIVTAAYILSCGLGAKKEDSAMEASMREVKTLIDDARYQIKKEMDKPFLLRLFGSLFGMEGNAFNNLKRELPGVIQRGMPAFIKSRAATPPPAPCSVAGLKFKNMLDTCSSHGLRIRKLFLDFDTTLIEGRYLNPSLSVLSDSVCGNEIIIVCQFPYRNSILFDDSRDHNRRQVEIIDSLFNRATPPGLLQGKNFHAILSDTACLLNSDRNCTALFFRTAAPAFDSIVYRKGVLR